MNKSRDVVADDNNVSYQVAKAKKALAIAKEIEQKKLDAGYTWQKDATMRIRRLVKPNLKKDDSNHRKQSIN